MIESTNTVEFDADRGTFRAAFDNSRDSASLAVVSVVAAVLERDPMDLTPLHSVIDTDALETLATRPSDSRETGISVSFQYEGREVTVEDGVIEVES